MNPNNWEVLIEGGRERTGLDVVEWASEVTRLGAGELLVTSVDKDGTKKGFDNELIAQVRSAVHVPVIASGGFGSTTDLGPLLGSAPEIDAISVATALHYDVASVEDIKSSLHEREGSKR